MNYLKVQTIIKQLNYTYTNNYAYKISKNGLLQW